MTVNYLELIRRSPYYYQVDGLLIEEHIPSPITNNFWEDWKSSLPCYCEEERVFLDLVRLENKNEFGSFFEAMSYFLGNENPFVQFIQQSQTTIEIIETQYRHNIVIPRREYWESIHSHLLTRNGQCEILFHYFLRLALQYYKNDWIAVILCLQALISGKILMEEEQPMKPKCFVKGTLIWTLDGIKPIEQVRVGDQVATHNGRFRTVLKTFQHKSSSRLYRIHTTEEQICVATDDHPFLVYNTEYDGFVWKRVCDLSRADFLVRGSIIMTSSSTNDGKEFVLQHLLEIDPEEMGNIMHEFMVCPEMVPEQMISVLSNREVRMNVWKWVLRNHSKKFVRGWMEEFRSAVDFSSEEEASMVMMVLSLYHYPMKVKRISCNRWRLSPPMVHCFERRQKSMMIGMKKVVQFSHKSRVLFSHDTVYSLHIDQDHSYIVNGYIVKNCMGVAPQTMIMTQDKVVPISQMRVGDMVLDSSYQPIEILKINKTYYEGHAMYVNDSLHTIDTLIYLQNNGKEEMNKMSHQPIRHKTPPFTFYYRQEIDDKMSTTVLNFLLRYLCDWTIQEKNGWCQWTITASDKLILPFILMSLHSFQFRLHEHDICIQEDVLKTMIDKFIFNLLYIKVEKLHYFFSYMNRMEPVRLTRTQYEFFVLLNAFVEEEKTFQLCSYQGDIYDLEVNGDGYCTTQTIVQKNKRIQIFEENAKMASWVHVPQKFFQEPMNNTIWEKILREQIQHGRPSLFCTDRSDRECVSGETRILTQEGIIRISSKQNEIVSVWNGNTFTNVLIAQTSQDKQFIKVHFSNGMSLLCTCHHKFFLVNKTVCASDLVCGDVLMPYQLPSLTSTDILPSSIVMTLEWIAKRCIHIEEWVVLYDRDMESLRDILLDLQYCGLKSEIHFNSFRHEYELRINKARWNLLNYRHFNKNSSSLVQGDWIDNIQVVKIEEPPMYGPSFCFHEPISGMAIFEGVCTGQCENMPLCPVYRFLLDVSRFLLPCKSKLQDHQVTVYTTKHCPFYKLLQMEYDKIKYMDIAIHSKDWETKRHLHAVTHLPAIFLDNLYVGGFSDFWHHYLCPVFDKDALSMYVRQLADITYQSIRFEIYGFRELLCRMRISIDDPQAKQLNRTIFETIHQCFSPESRLILNSMEEPTFLYRVFRLYPWDKNQIHQLISNGSLANTNLPNSLKKIFQNDYECSQEHRLQLLIDRKTDDDTFHVYVDKSTEIHTLLNVQQQAFCHGFSKIQIHHSCP